MSSDATNGAVLVLGALGMLGRAMCAELRRQGRAVIAADLREVDVASCESVIALARSLKPQRPGLIINCAAWTDVDGAEANEAQATAANGDAIGHVLLAASEHLNGALLVNFGTDYVFDGAGRAPYGVDQPLTPLNAYGRSKAAGERILKAAPQDAWLHIRTSWLYAPWGKNFVRTMRQLLLSRPAIKVVSDQRGRPTSAEHLARAALALVEHRQRGVFHATDGGECTWYELAVEVGRLCGASGRAEPCTSDAFPRPARRPAYSVLDITATEALLGPMPDWKANLADVMSRIEP